MKFEVTVGLQLTTFISLPTSGLVEVVASQRSWQTGGEVVASQRTRQTGGQQQRCLQRLQATYWRRGQGCGAIKLMIN